jgi:YD repeat-containing protein
VSESVPPGGGPRDHIDHDGNGLVAASTTPANVRTSYTRDDMGNVLTMTIHDQGQAVLRWVHERCCRE